jgi:predicted Rossmann fold nucleotide-binding protein DprA/Smf involved in DNA uptake
MISLDLMRQYVEAADQLATAESDRKDAERRIKAAEQLLARLEPKMEGKAPPRVTLTKHARQTTPKIMEGVVSAEELMERTRKANKKIRGEATLAILQAMPGTLPQITERTGLKKASVSTLVARLQNDGVIKKDGEELLPGYENRFTFRYSLAV